VALYAEPFNLGHVIYRRGVACVMTRSDASVASRVFTMALRKFV
jgi:hypothetical protein